MFNVILQKIKVPKISRASFADTVVSSSNPKKIIGLAGEGCATLRGCRADTRDASPFLMHDEIFEESGSTSLKKLGG